MRLGSSLRHRLRLLCLLALAGGMLPASSCETKIIDNSEFDLWCGDHLCGWEVLQGAIKRVPTWHQADFGISLVGQEVVLAQRSEVSDSDFQCLRFDVLAERDRGVRLTLELDYYDDGLIDDRRELRGDDYRPWSVELAAPSSFDGVRFIIRKQGAGKAVLAELSASATDGCEGQQPPVVPAPLGAPCDHDEQCGSGICEDNTHQPAPHCVECSGDGDCVSGQVCGLDLHDDDLLLAQCGPADRSEPGEPCLADAECDDGLCCPPEPGEGAVGWRCAASCH